MKSFFLIGVIGGSLVVSSLVLILFRSRTRFELSYDKNVMGWDDITILLSIGIEKVQFLLLGPDFEKYIKNVDFLKEFLYVFVLDWKN